MGITVVNDNAYVADGSSGFQVFDVSDVTNPSHIGGYDVVGSPWGVDVDGHFAYLANYESGLYIVDISEPFTPTMRGDYNTWGESFDLDVVNDIAYVADDGGLSVIDVADKDNPVFLDRHNIGYGDTNKVHVVGNLAYAASKNAGLHILDISSPTSVNSVGSYTDTFASDVAVVGNIAYVADMYDGLKVVDVSNPNSPSLLAEWQEDWVEALDVSEERVYLIAGSELHTIDVSNPVSPSLMSSYRVSGAQEVQVINNVAYIASQSKGVQVVDVSNPQAPITITSYDTPGHSYDLEVVGDLVFVADIDGGLQILRLQYPPSLEANYTSGAPGSFFTFTGASFPSNSTASIVVNGHTLGTVSTDSSGGFTFLLDTSQAETGHYIVTASVNPSATTRIALDPDEPLYPQEGEGEVLEVPSGIAYTSMVYLPLVQRQ
jgi:hypothetical protein